MNGFGFNEQLLEAVEEGNLEFVEELLQMGVDINVRNEYGKTPLMIALGREDHTDIVELLLKNGADVNIESITPVRSLIVRLTLQGWYNCVEALLDRNDNNIDIEDYEMALRQAQENEYENIVELLRNKRMQIEEDR